MSTGSNEVRRKSRVYRKPHSTIAKSRANSLLGRFHVVKTEVSYHILLGRPWLHKHRLVPSTYHQCVKGRLNGKMIRIAANPSPFEQAEAHLVETMFYYEWAPSGESSMSKPQGTFVPWWEDIQEDPEPDLRELLMWRKKRKEAPTSKLSGMPRCARIRTPDGRIVYKLWRCTRPTCNTQGGLGWGSQHKSLMCCVAQENSKEESDAESERMVATEKDAQVTTEEKLEEIDLGTHLQ